MTNYLEKGVKGTFIVSLFISLAYLVGYFTRVFLARVMMPDEYGLFYAVFTVFMFICVFTDPGYNTALVKFIPAFIVRKDKDSIAKSITYVFFITFSLSLIAGIILLLTTNFLTQYYFKTPLAINLLRIFVFILIINPIVVLFGTVFQAFQNMFKYGFLYFLNKALFFLSCFALFYLGVKGISIPAFGYLITLILLIIFFAPSFYELARPLKFRELIKRFEMKLFSRITIFALPNFLTSIAAMIIGYIDTIILTYIVSLDKVGVYNAVLPTALVLSQLGATIATVFFPMASELWVRKEYMRLKHGLALISKYLLILILPLALSMLFFSKTILQLFFGQNFVSGSLTLSILSVGVIFITIAQVNFSVLNGIGRPKEITKITLAAAIFNAASNIILIPIFGIEGAAFTTTLSYLIMMIWSNILIRKRFPFKFEKMFGILVSSFIFLLSLYMLKNILSMNIYLESILCLIISWSIYVVAVFIFRVITLEEVVVLIRKRLKLLGK